MRKGWSATPGGGDEMPSLGVAAIHGVAVVGSTGLDASRRETHGYLRTAAVVHADRKGSGTSSRGQ